MNQKEKFVAYEYKNVNIKRDSAALYADCMANFGWELIDQRLPGFQTGETVSNQIASAATSFANVLSAPEQGAGEIEVTQRYRRDREIHKNSEVVKLERQCEQALSTIGGMKKKNQVFTMGTSLGIGILGTVFLGFAVYNFIFAHIVTGILLALIGIAGWAIGFFANIKGGKKREAQSETMIQKQLDIAYGACEQAHALLA